MDKKTILYSLALVAIAGGLGASQLYASEPTADTKNCSYGPQHGERPGIEHNLSQIADEFGLDKTALQEQIDSGTPMHEILAENGITPEDMREARQVAMQNRLAQAVASGTITQAQADERIAMMTEHETRHEAMFTEKADFLGIPAEELRAELALGKTFFEIAEEQGISQEEFEAFMETHRPAGRWGEGPRHNSKFGF